MDETADDWGIEARVGLAGGLRVADEPRQEALVLMTPGDDSCPALRTQALVVVVVNGAAGEMLEIERDVASHVSSTRASGPSPDAAETSSRIV